MVQTTPVSDKFSSRLRIGRGIATKSIESIGSINRWLTDPLLAPWETPSPVVFSSGGGNAGESCIADTHLGERRPGRQLMSHRILYVDDEPDMRDIVSLSLGRDPSFEVRSCGSGREALEIAADWRPDLILLDVVMPDMDGPATLARLKDIPAMRSVPVVFITARSHPAEVTRLTALGATGVIAKPFSPKTLAPTVKTYLIPSAESDL